MKEIRNSEQLQRWLLESGHLARLWDRPRFFFDSEEFENEIAGVRMQYPQFSDTEAEARASLRLMGKEEGRGRSLHLTGRRHWTRRERMFLVAVLALVAAIAALLAAPRAHGQTLPPVAAVQSPSPVFDFRISHFVFPWAFERYRFWNLQGGQPTGVIWQWQQGGSALHTFAGGVGFVNCSTNITCTFSSSPPTVTITGSGGSGSGCIPPGSTANALLFDAGSGACNDVPKLTWNGGTNTLSLLSGGIFDPTAGTVKVPGTNGQLLYNNSGALGAEDPVVSGPDARGAAQTKNPVAGLGGIDYGSGCAGGPCVQEAKVDSSGNVYVDVTNTVPVSGTFWQATQPVSGTFWQAIQPVSGTVTANAGSGTFAVSAASLPLPSGASTSANQCGTSSTPCEVTGHGGGNFDAATNASAPANGIQPIELSANALPSAVTPGNTVAPMADKFGRQVVLVNSMRDLLKPAAVQTTNATQTTLLAAQTSQYADLVSLTITSESSTACTVSLTDGTTTYKFNVANQQGAGFVWNPVSPLPAASTATAWQVTGCASVTLDYVALFVLNK